MPTNIHVFIENYHLQQISNMQERVALVHVKTTKGLELNPTAAHADSKTLMFSSTT